MILNYSDQINYVVRAVGVQERIIAAMTDPTGFLGIYLFVMAEVLFIWARRIADKGEWGRFCAWAVISSFLIYATFKNTRDMPIDLQEWIPNVSGVTLAYTPASIDNKAVQNTVVKGAPAIDMFFSTVTEVVNTTAVTMIVGMGETIRNTVFVADKSCASVEAVFTDAYLQYIRDIGTGGTVYGKSDGGATVAAFTGQDFPKCVGYRKLDSPPTLTMTDPKTGKKMTTQVGNIPACDDFWKRYTAKARACLNQKKDPAGELTASLTTQYEQPEIAKGIGVLEKAVNGGGLADASYPLTYGVGADNTISWIARFVDYGLAKIGAQLQPELQKRTVTLLVIQVVCMGFIIALSPFAVVWSIIPWGDSTINAKFLFKYLAAFGFTVAWYPLLLFGKAFLYGSLIN